MLVSKLLLTSDVGQIKWAKWARPTGHNHRSSALLDCRIAC
jgi:hypothetical protein